MPAACSANEPIVAETCEPNLTDAGSVTEACWISYATASLICRVNRARIVELAVDAFFARCWAVQKLIQQREQSVRDSVNGPDHPSSKSGLARVAPGLVGFLHFFTLGAALPLFPLYLKETLGYSWTITGVILTAIPFSLLIAQVFVRSLSQFGIDVRLGLAVSHLLAAGVAMAAAFRVAFEVPVTFAWPYAFGLTVLYFALLAPSMTWMARVGDAATSSGRSIIRLWRVWGTVGFIAPAWLFELLLVRFPHLVSAVESHEILIPVAGWAGLATAFAAILLPEVEPEPVDVAGSALQSGDVSSGKLGIPLAIAVLMIVVVQRCHYLWNAPFFESIMQQHEVRRQFVYRLIVADQVFELLGLFMLGVGVLKVGTRVMLVAGASAWFGRAVLLAWMSQSAPSGQMAIACLCGAQVLQGVAIAAFFGTLGVILRLHHGVGACRYQIMLVSVCGILGMLIGGVIADDILGGAPAFFLTQLPELVGLSTAENPGVARWLQGWAGVWCLSALPCLLAILLAGLSKASSISFERLR
jgi:hypothetical protein